jgi:hypothetical protein
MSRACIVILVALWSLASPVAAETFSNRMSPSTTNNDDSCDITVAPAATLLLPFFDVDLTKPPGTGDTTLFTITNTASAPQIAHVTIWTDWAYPLLTFNLFLTGYDVQAVNLYDVLVGGVVAPGGQITRPGTFAGPGSQPGLDESNPNLYGGTAGSCPRPALEPELVAALQSALRFGLYNVGSTKCGFQRIGGTHTNMRGYVTIDVVANCSDLLPTNPAYYSTQILFDNVLIGDYQQLRSSDPTLGSFAHAMPMVHIRAVPEGGPPGFVPPGTTNLPYTFYDRYTPSANRRMDRRIPLPSTFAVRWIEQDNRTLSTWLQIWREGLTTGAQTNCSGAVKNLQIPAAGSIRFDERENSFKNEGSLRCGATCHLEFPTFPAAALVNLDNGSSFPAHPGSTDVAGWLYLDLNSQSSPGSRPSQNWVTALMVAQGRYAAEFDAAQLGNGCTAAAAVPPRVGPAQR